jgi:hypothetical protein
MWCRHPGVHLRAGAVDPMQTPAAGLEARLWGRFARDGLHFAQNPVRRRLCQHESHKIALTSQAQARYSQLSV